MVDKSDVIFILMTLEDIMKGCRPLNSDEEKSVLSSFEGSYAPRDKAIFVLGTKSGLRISEILSLRIRDVIQVGSIVDRIYVERKNIKKNLKGDR